MVIRDVARRRDEEAINYYLTTNDTDDRDRL